MILCKYWTNLALNAYLKTSRANCLSFLNSRRMDASRIESFNTRPSLASTNGDDLVDKFRIMIKKKMNYLMFYGACMFNSDSVVSQNKPKHVSSLLKVALTGIVLVVNASERDLFVLDFMRLLQAPHGKLLLHFSTFIHAGWNGKSLGDS